MSVSSQLRTLLDRLNQWLEETFEDQPKISTILENQGLTKEEIDRIKSYHLQDYLNVVISFLAPPNRQEDNNHNQLIWLRCTGLLTGQREILEDIGDSYRISRENVREIYRKHQLYLYQKRPFIQTELANIARRLLGQTPIEEPHHLLTYIEKVRIQHERAYASWSQDEDARLMELVESGQSAKQIAEQLQRRPSAIRSRIKKLDPDKQVESKRAKNKEAKRPVRYGEIWSDAEDEKILHYYQMGYDEKKIAALVERTIGSVSSRIRKLRNQKLDKPYVVGVHPQTGIPIAVFPSPYEGPVILYERQTIPIPYHMEPNHITLEIALDFLEGKRA